MLDKIYLEITNVCNLDCSFCHKTAREKRFMTKEEFDLLTNKLQGKIKYLYFHLMGEPTLHPHLPEFIKAAREKGFLPIITTNGSLLEKRGDALIENIPYKISISLHAPEANPAFNSKGYIDSCISFARRAAEKECIVALRLWNLGSDADNSEILARLHEAFPDEWVPVRRGSGQRLAHKIFLEWGDRFEWPDQPENEEKSKCSSCGEQGCQKSNKSESSDTPSAFCYALRDQAGVLVDGTIVPCCLDADGRIPLGNLFTDELEDALSSPRAKALYNGFSQRRAVEPLCQSCGFIKRFK